MGRPGAQRNEPGDVHSLLALGHGATDDHVLDLFRIERRHAIYGAFHGNRAKIVGTSVTERAFGRFSHGCANRANYYCFLHNLPNS